MAVKLGRYAKVTMGTDTVVGMGNWAMPGITTEQIETTSFGSIYKTFEAGFQDGGEITFAGNYDPADTIGQTALRTANENATHVTNLRLYIDSTSYFAPDQSTTPASYVLITNYNVTFDKADVGKTSFTAKISGKMSLS